MSYPLPYQGKSIPLKAFVLGCDPTAFKDGEQIHLKTAFCIGQDGRYFAEIRANLIQFLIGFERNL